MTGAVAGMLARARRPAVTGLRPDAMPGVAMAPDQAPADAVPGDPQMQSRGSAQRAPGRNLPVVGSVERGRPRAEPNRSAPLPAASRVAHPPATTIAPAGPGHGDPAPDPTMGRTRARSALPARSRLATATPPSPSELVGPTWDSSPARDVPIAATAATTRLQRGAVSTEPTRLDAGSRPSRDAADGERRPFGAPVDGPAARISPGTPESAHVVRALRPEPVAPVVIQSIRVEVAGSPGPAPDPFAGLRHHLGGITRWGRR